MLGLFFWQKYKSLILARGLDYRGSTWPSLPPLCTKVQSHFFLPFVDHILSNKLPFKNNITITPFSCSFPSLFYGWCVHCFNQPQTCDVSSETSYWEAYGENTPHPITGLFLLDTISVGNFHIWGSLTNSI